MMKKRLLIGFCILLTSSVVAATEGISGDIFGKYVGILHPALSIDLAYSDNIYKTRDDKEGDTVTTISPSIWLAFPGIREKLSEIDISNTSPGGLSLELTKNDTFKRYQTFFYYSPEIVRYIDLSDESIENNRLGCVFQLNLRGGLSINLIEQYQNSHEAMGTGLTRFQDRFQSNLIYMILYYDVTDKISLRGDYSNFQIGYAHSSLEYGNRSDNNVSTYFFYKVLPKTSVFGEIEYSRIGYENTGFYDSDEMRYFTGVKWDITDKSEGRFKTGYGMKNFDENTIDTSGDLILELDADIRFTPDTKVNITGLRRSTETTVLDTEYSLVNSFLVDYNQAITHKINMNLGLLFTNENYKGEVLYDTDMEERKDNVYRILSAIEYRLNDWLATIVEYSYTKRTSNVDDYEYGNNVFMFGFSGTL